ncbi:hypothetical protein CO174_05205 [Candidatus Uhrbacteria bacterium CG_4_9_14_3_um_filter_50_9]|uniref:Uncharacterized protein n=1 Tax=Candidatus Uhrbacteria bacterium CG_4_9_14_3_um_filter_50_9 TaxID=1975035 RepID=A0A2M7XB13_9BACT|nr:MAG: hypothetical protein CO174_05205 [Candidatus Uhrbacteria bacterium CG_4_9_14_3_um_filter_50_9]
MSSFHQFRPEDALIFHKLPHQFRIVIEMGRIYDDLICLGIEPKVALYTAYVRTHQSNKGPATTVGDDKFYDHMSGYLRSARGIVRQLIQENHQPFSRSLAPHNRVSVCLDPIQMLTMATQNPGTHADRLSYRLQFEARRQFGIALQLFAIEAVDSDLRVSQDLFEIDKLAQERLFSKETSREVGLVAWQDQQNQYRMADVQIFDRRTREEAVRRARELKRAHEPFIEDQLTCRVARDNGRAYVVYAIDRGKELLPTLLKLERGRQLTDRRGWKYVVIGVDEGDGLRVATRKDAQDFLDFSARILWKLPLLNQEDEGSPNPNRDRTYWDLKLTGHFLRECQDDGRIILGPAEQLVTTIGDHLDADHAHADVNHRLYRASQIDEYINPIWFPHTYEAFKGIVRMRRLHLPGYGVNWGSKDVKRRLYEWRLSQIETST